jgi:uncharacterized protein YkwD
VRKIKTSEKYIAFFIIAILTFSGSMVLLWSKHSKPVTVTKYTVQPIALNPLDDPAHFNSQTLFTALNDYRLNNGIPALTENPELDASALAHAKDMQTRGYYSHTTPDGITSYNRIAAALGRAVIAGENQDDICGAPTVNTEMSRLSNSPEHKINMLDKNYTDVGIAWVPSLTSHTCNGYVVYDFVRL